MHPIKRMGHSWVGMIAGGETHVTHSLQVGPLSSGAEACM